MTESCTALIVGAGPVGIFCALKLAQAGVDTILVEATEELEDAAKALIHMPAARLEFKKTGVLDDLLKEAGEFNDTGICFRKTSDKSIIADIHKQPGAPGPFIVPQYQFCTILFEHLHKCKNARVHMGHKFQGLTINDGKVSVKTQTNDGTEKTFETTYLIGADGGKSPVRKASGIKFEGETLPRNLIACDVVYPFGKYGFIDGNFMADPNHYGLIGPIKKGDLWRVSYAVPDTLSMDEIKAGIPEKFEAMMPGPRPLEYEVKRIAPYKAQQLCASTFRQGNVFLVGDSAHRKSYHSSRSANPLIKP